MKNYKKAYKDVLNVIKELYPNMTEYQQEKLQGICPELAESEDERIRKEMLDFFCQFEDKTLRGVDISSWIAWLEKHGEQRETLCDKCRREQPSHSCQDITELGRCALEHQSKQKPTDKLKPKFKVGDWVVTDNQTVLFVDKIYEYDYYVIDTNNWLPYKYTIKTADEKCHLWTIADAKDGDILNSVRVQATIIFKDWDSDGKHINAYCALQQGILIKQELPWDRDFEPAPKEWCDKLMQAMTKAGYKWDREKKELKKIEQKPKVYDSMDDLIADALIEEIENSELNDKSKHNRIHWIKSHRQNPSWSEEDEKMLDEIVDFFENGTVKLQHDLSLYASWLKSLKPNHWKPSAEQMKALERTVSISNFGIEQERRNALVQLFEELKKL